MKTSLLAVFGNDRPGIIANVTGLLYKNHCNLEDVTMTVLEGEFSMLVVVSYAKNQKRRLDEQLQILTQKNALSFFWTPLNTKRLKRGASYESNRVLYVISAIGRDRTGIVYFLSRELAKAKLNISDLNSKILGQGSKTLYAMVLEVEAPEKFPIIALKRKLEKTAKRLKIDLTLKPVERLEC